VTNAPLWESGAPTTIARPDDNPVCYPLVASPARKILPYGPFFVEGIDPIERARKLMCFAGITACHLGSGHPLVSELRLAETDVAALEDAFAMFERLPALPRRRIISVYAAVMYPRQRGGVAS
jgi:hypothetical protein